MKKEQLIESLKKVKQSICDYGKEYQGFCDCKFIKNQTLEEIKKSYNEATGCCEISMAIHILSNMSDQAYEILIKRPESQKLPKEKSREEHIAEFWQSFYNAIQKAKGSVSSHHPHMTLIEVAEVLAQNNIRFVYKNN